MDSILFQEIVDKLAGWPLVLVVVAWLIRDIIKGHQERDLRTKPYDILESTIRTLLEEIKSKIDALTQKIGTFIEKTGT